MNVNEIMLDFFMINFLLVYIVFESQIRKFISRMAETQEKDIKIQRFIEKIMAILVIMCIFVYICSFNVKNEFIYMYLQAAGIILLWSIFMYICYVRTVSLRDYIFVSGREQRAIGGSVAAVILIILFIFKENIDIFMMF